VRTLRELLRIARLPRARVVASVSLGSLSVLLGVGLMSIAGYVISRAAEHPPILSLTVAIVAVRVCGIGKPVSRYLERLERHDLAFRVLARMRVGFFRKIEPLVPGRLPELRRGDLLAAMVGDIDAMENLFVLGVAPPLVALVAGAISVAIAAAYLPAAGIVLAVGLLVGGIGIPSLAAFGGRNAGPRQAAARAEMTAELVDVLRGAPELLVLGAAEQAAETVRTLDAELVHLGRRDALVSGVVEGLSTAVSGLTVAGVLVVCVAATGAGSLDRVMVASLALLAMASFETVAPLPAAASVLRSTIASGRRLLDITGQAPSVVDPSDPADPPRDPAVTLEQVGFGYANEESWALHDVSFRLAPGRKVALVGRSGAGKSTIAALMVRFLDPDTGRVTVGATDTRALRQQDVRSFVTLDAQEAYLFSTTIRENVRLANPSAGDDEIERALRRAQIWEWVASLPDGWDTFVGEEGTLVSGGERRRIALARTFLADAPVVVLDEPTAHLDQETAERLVDDALHATEGRTILLITHRAEGLDSVDEIVRLRRGRIDQPGPRPQRDLPNHIPRKG
jgi:ATP-binding cassette, subfamily C, bacterial CydC